MLLRILIFGLISSFWLANIEGNQYISYGPDIKSTVGQVWPKPFWQDDTGRYFALDPNNFKLVAVNKNCALLQEALRRYSAIIRKSAQGYVHAPPTAVVHQIQQLKVNLTQTCETLPHLHMDESYYVWGDGRIIANSVWGVLRGLETLSQLMVPMANELSAKGAYRPEMTYNVEDVKEIVEFARKRGIRVIPEFDTPAHTASWGASHPEIMTECFGELAGQLGPINPTREKTYEFLYKFFSEIRTLFPDEYLHLGVDEVDWACWESNPQIQSYLASKGLENVDLPYMYLERFSANMSALKWKQMLWQEGITENFWMEWPAGTIGQIWFDYAANAHDLTAHNYDIIRSQDWYLYVLETGGDWEKFYLIEPLDFEGTEAQKKHVLGGEACLWSEFINEHNVLPTTFPRVSAIAERLWSEKAHRDTDEATPRIEEHNCRMIFRGIEARPANSYGLC